MNSHARKGRLNVAVAMLALASPLLAWADCVDMRKLTTAETDFYNRAVAALVAALPPMPVGARLAQGDQHSFQRLPHMPNLCADEKIGDFEFRVRRSYEIFTANPYQRATVLVLMNVRQLPGPARDSAAYGTGSPGRSAGLKVHNIVWSLEGTSGSPLYKAVSDGFDRARLEGMVGKPLPSVAESKALAAAAVPATVATATAPAPATAAPPASNPPATPSPPVTAGPAAPPSPAQPAAHDPTKDAVDTVNRLRGLFGR